MAKLTKDQLDAIKKTVVFRPLSEAEKAAPKAPKAKRARAPRGSLESICRAYAPVPMPTRLHLMCAYVTARAEQTPAQTALLDAEIERTGMTLAKAELIARTWREHGWNPWSAMDIAELEMLKREYGSLVVAGERVLGDVS